MSVCMCETEGERGGLDKKLQKIKKENTLTAEKKEKWVERK